MHSDFVREHTTLTDVPLVPEVRLLLARDPYAIFQVREAIDATAGTWPPFWAFAWPGGQGLARYILDHPSLVAGKHILDIGSGSGLTSIAAIRAGARSALAADVDPVAEAAARANAALNGVELETTTRDLLGEPPDADLIVLGDIVYDPELYQRVSAFIESARRGRIDIMLGDRTTARRPAGNLELLAEYEAPALPELQEGCYERARVFALRHGGRSRQGGKP